jgi:hypothetical protein
MNKTLIACAVLLTLSFGACSSNPSPGGQTTTETDPAIPGAASDACSCDQFPFPKACASKCEAEESVIKSVNLKNDTAVVQLQKSGVTVNETVALKSLPASEPIQEGARFTALSKKDTVDPAKSRIVAFTKIAK